MLRLFRWLLILASLFNFTPHRSPIEGIRYWVSEWGEHRSVCKYLVTNLNGLLIREGKCYSSLHKGPRSHNAGAAVRPDHEWHVMTHGRGGLSSPLRPMSAAPGAGRGDTGAVVCTAGRRGGSVQCGTLVSVRAGRCAGAVIPLQAVTLLYITITIKQCLQQLVSPSRECL